MDTPDEGVQGEGGTGADESQSESGAKAESFFLKTYRTKEDAERALDEKENTVRTYQSQVDKLKAENAKLQSETLAKLAEVVASKSHAPGPSRAETEAELEKLAAEVDANGGKGVLKVLGMYQHDLESRLKGEFQKHLDEVRVREQADLEALKAQLRDSDPAYQARKPVIDQIKQEFGISDNATAMKLADKLFPDAKFPKPGGTQARSAGTPKSDEEFDDSFTKELDGVKPMTAEEKKALQAVMARKARGRK